MASPTLARVKGVSLAFIAALYISVIHGAGGTTFEIQNKCAFTVWAAGSIGGGRGLDRGQSWTLQISAGGPTGRFWGRAGCLVDGGTSCTTSDCGGLLNCPSFPMTLVEYALNENQDFYDISLVDGFSVPTSIIPSNPQCKAVVCSSDINSVCPAELRLPKACMSACLAFNSPQYCCTGDYGTPQSCPPTIYSRFFKTQCPQAYSYAYDDASSTFACPTGADYKIVFCDGDATNPQGFLSIDCGGTTNHIHNNITWVTDALYIDAGDTTDTGNTSLPSYLQRLRFFPKPLAKSCYQLPVVPDVPYLFRLWFAVGNYSRFQNLPRFAFSIETRGLLAVQNVTITNSDPINYEGILVSSGNVLYICLIRTTDNDDPFINAIELRKLEDGMYPQAKRGTMLRLVSRQDLGGNSTIRYPLDNFDRIWTSNTNFDTPGLVRHVNSQEPISSKDMENFPPTAVMQTAWVMNVDSFEFTLPTTYTAKSLLKLYFAEIETLNMSESRSFYVTIDGEKQPETIEMEALNFSCLERTFISNITNNFKFGLVKATNSKRGPILNAFEHYSLHDTYKATYSQDLEALDAVQTRINLKDWISDPCYLIQWEGIICDYTSSEIRISEINLSGKNLTGAIPDNIGQLTALVNVSLDNNYLIGDLPDFSNLTMLEGLHLQNNNLSGRVPGWISKLKNLKELSLDNNKLIGQLPNFSNLTMLERLHLNNNNLDGSVPDWLSEFKNLKELFINNNNFSGIIPQQLLDNPSLNLKYSGNHYLCMNKGECQRISRKDKMSVVLGITISGALILVLVLIAGIAVYRKKFKTKQHLNEDYALIMVPNPAKSHSFTLEQIVQATQNFNRKIGQGGFGSVFFGKLPEGKDIAVKVLSLFSREGVHQFQNEVDLLSKIHHKNLVSLLGYCNESRELMLIYEYMSQGSLRDHLYGPSAEVSQLNWKTRLRIALDAAEGLKYLHVACSPKIIHRDVKTANILLDSNMNGKLADFGLSRMTINGEASHVTTAVKGTIGYLDPEYFRTQMLTEKSDVYSFGVVLLEIICGRPPINASLPEEELNLIEWVTPYVEMDENLGNIEVIIDKRLGGNYSLKSIVGVVKLAFRCVEARPFSRPGVSEVVAQIEEAIIHENENNVPLPNSEGIGTQHGDLQTCLVHSRVESIPRKMEWADNSSNLAQVGR